jgi:hypothetical protein
MLKYFTISVLCVAMTLSTSCRQAQKTAYNTDTLRCLEELFSSQETGAEAAIKVADKYKDRFQFAHTLQEKLSDRYCIENIEKLSVKGEFAAAQKTLNQQITQRGYTPVLSKSTKTLEAAVMIKKYTTDINNMSTLDSAREFGEILVNTTIFKRNIAYKKWLNQQKKKITLRAIKEKKSLNESLSQTIDTLSLTEPSLLEICLLQKAIHKNSSLIPSLNVTVDPQLAEQLTSVGLSSYTRQHYIDKLRATKTISKPSTLLDIYANIHAHTNSGKTATALIEFQKIAKLINIDKQYRKLIISKLLKTKGWNNTSLINGNILDISYLLETFYLAND